MSNSISQIEDDQDEGLFLGDCDCENIINGCCEDCGRHTVDSKDGSYIDSNQSFTLKHQYTAAPKVIFEDEIKALNIPEEVKALAIKIANSSVQKTHRNAVRRKQIFAYVYFAFSQCNLSFSPKDVAKQLKLSNPEINRALQMVSGSSQVRIPLPVQNNVPMALPIVVISPKTYIQSVCIKNNISSEFEQIYKLAEYIMDNDTQEAAYLLEQNPEHVAIAIAKLYLDNKNIKTPQFAKINEISDLVLKNRLAELKEVIEVLKK